MRRPDGQVDVRFLIITLALVVIGMAMVFSASYAKAQTLEYCQYDSYYFMKRQAMFVLIGLVALYLAYRVDFRLIRKASYLSALAAIIALGLVLVPGIGTETFGSRRAFPIGSFHFQPSEFAKLAMVLALALYLSKHPKEVESFSGLAKSLAVLGAMVILIMLEPDLGTAVALIMTALVLLHLGGVRFRQIAVLGLVAAGLAGISLWLNPHQMERLNAWRDPWGTYDNEGYQICHSLMAIGTGGIGGLGFCHSREKHLYLPAASTDSIMAIIGEEWGLIGSWAILGLFIWFSYRGFELAHRTRDRYASLVAGGITLMISIQALINMAVVTNSIPTTGIPLPFISYGGSSLIMAMIGVGILLNISRGVPVSRVRSR